MLLRFTKMHGLGNDFVVIDALSNAVRLSTTQIRRMADRNTGIGFDQLLIVEAPHTPQADFRYRIFNANGNEVEQCGNGARCFALFVWQKKLTPKKKLLVETKTRTIVCEILENNQIRVDMGFPIFTPQLVPFTTQNEQDTYILEVDNQQLEIGVLSMGNPHAVIVVADVDEYDVGIIGAQIENHPQFPAKVNVGFLQITETNTAKLRVFERDVGETKACGTGACAAAVFAIKQGLLTSPAQIQLPGGEVIIEWQGKNVLMTGPAIRVFEGQIKL